MRAVVVKCEVSACTSKGPDPRDGMSWQCVYPDRWAHCGQRHLAFGATQLMGQLAHRQNQSGLITAPAQPPSSFSSLSSSLLSTPRILSPATGPPSEHCVACNRPRHPPRNIHHIPRGALTAGSSHADWLGTRADSDARGDIFRARGMDGRVSVALKEGMGG